jgi:hypothetical protein
MHGSGAEIEGETRVFKSPSGMHEVQMWHSAYTKWLSSGPVHSFSAAEVGSNQFAALEVTAECLLLGDELYIGTFMRLMDPVSGNPLASGFAHQKFIVHPIKNAADLDAFVLDYRKCARQISETHLRQLRLIP